MLGHRTVDVVFFDGEERDAFIEGVRANISHGKPLTLSDRRAAATRILESHCHLSDRAISEICGLSSKTVGSLRQRASASVPQSRARIGLDGRVRPLDASAGRLRAAEVLAERPGASLREVASVAGISPGTVRDVRDRLRQGRDAVVSRPAPASEPCEEPSRPCPIETVGSDPAITSSEEGRALLEWMMGHAVTSQDWEPFVDAVPVSRIYLVADAARKVATAWVGFAESLEKRTHRR